MPVLPQDLRYAFRTFRTSPAFTAVAVATLALGIGANSAIFSIVDAVLLRELPYRDAARLALIWAEIPELDVRQSRWSFSTWEQAKRATRAFEDLAAFDPLSLILTGAGDPVKISGARVTPSLFSILGVAPAAGRTFTDQEAERRERVAVIAHSLWQQQFGGSLQAIGQDIEIDGRRSKIIGIMPSGFNFPGGVQIWEPHTLFPDFEAGRAAPAATGAWFIVGRLGEGVSIDQAIADWNAALAGMQAADSESGVPIQASVEPLPIHLIGRDRAAALWTIAGAVAFVLLIACANIASLLMARSSTRQRELGLHVALGATRGRLIRQLLTESVALSVLAGVAGLALAAFCLPLIAALAPVTVPRLGESRLDFRVLAFTSALSLVAGLVFGLIPAFRISRRDARDVIGDGGRSTSGGLGLKLNAPGLLVSFEFALALTLVTGAVVLVQSFLRVQNVDPGFDRDRVMLAQLAAPPGSDGSRQAALWDQVLERIHTLPGVRSAGIIDDFFIGSTRDQVITVQTASGAGTARYEIRTDAVSPGFFRATNVPLLSGRLFGPEDRAGSAPVAIVNEEMARRCWPAGNPVGRQFKRGDRESTAPWYTVVGVVGDMRRENLEKEPVLQIFEPSAQRPSRLVTLAVRTDNDPAQLAFAVRKAVAAIDPGVPVYGVATMRQLLADSTALRRFQAWLAGLFAVLALLLAAVGIYGVIHYLVARRRREIGVRLALGAQRSDVLKMVLREGLLWAVAGVVLGSVASIVVVRALSSQLYDATSAQPAMFAAVSGGLVLVAAAACWLPARRATAVDPLEALRSE